MKNGKKKRIPKQRASYPTTLFQFLSLFQILNFADEKREEKENTETKSIVSHHSVSVFSSVSDSNKLGRFVLN
jgi:hypothetical protein